MKYIIYIIGIFCAFVALVLMVSSLPDLCTHKMEKIVRVDYASSRSGHLFTNFITESGYRGQQSYKYLIVGDTVAVPYCN